MKMTITRAYDELAAKGYTLISGLPYDLEAKTARYLVATPNGDEVEMTSTQIIEMVRD